MRVGMGYDIHRLEEKRKLMIGGVHMPHRKGEAGHSDGDVLLHALIDALLGAASLGDIGSHFPPGDPAWKDISSIVLLRKTKEMVKEAGYIIVNCDCTVILEEPKLLPHRTDITERIAEGLSIPPSSVSIKAKTNEGVDAAGREEAVEAYAVVLIEETDGG